MIFKNEHYDFFKKLGNVILPALAVLYGTLGDIWSLPFTKEIPLTIVAVATFLNELLQKSSDSYFEDKIIVERYEQE